MEAVRVRARPFHPLLCCTKQQTPSATSICTLKVDLVITMPHAMKFFLIKLWRLKFCETLVRKEIPLHIPLSSATLSLRPSLLSQ
jgi:hypothetical protein